MRLKRAWRKIQIGLGIYRPELYFWMHQRIVKRTLAKYQTVLVDNTYGSNALLELIKKKGAITCGK